MQNLRTLLLGIFIGVLIANILRSFAQQVGDAVNITALAEIILLAVFAEKGKEQ